MRINARALQIGMLLAMSALIFAGCGTRESPVRAEASEIAVFQMDIQATQKQEATPAQFEIESMAQQTATANIAAPATMTPKIAGNSASERSTSDADIDALMDDLEDTLNELDAAITVADQDTLTDATLATLEK